MSAISTPKFVEKAEVVAMLRSRDLHSRADWVNREMPAFIDVSINASLLRTLGIDVTTLSPKVPTPSGAAPEQPSP